MKNEFGAMKTVRDLILRGYGYTQMLDKAGLTEDDLVKLCTSYSDFNNEIIKRYKKDLAAQAPKKEKEVIAEPKEEVVEEKAQENNDLEELKAKAKAAGIKNWYNKKAETLIKELAELN
jgi:hypothetical protein